MNDGRGSGQDPGLCASCAHAQSVRNNRGSQFWLCRLSAVDGRFAKYPALPVVACVGYESCQSSVVNRQSTDEPPETED
jgi:hypothetical protein